MICIFITINSYGWIIITNHVHMIISATGNSWVTGRKVATEPGFLISTMVDNVGTPDSIIANGDKIIQPPRSHA